MANDETIINAIVTNPRVMRQMPQLLRETDLQLLFMRFIRRGRYRARGLLGVRDQVTPEAPSQGGRNESDRGRGMGLGDVQAIGPRVHSSVLPTTMVTSERRV